MITVHLRSKMADVFTLEEKAMESLVQLMQAARECRAKYDAARLPIPDRLRRFLEEPSPTEPKTQPKITIPPPPHPPRPEQWQGDWIWVPVTEVNPTALVRGVLRGATDGLTPKEIGERIAAMGVEFNKGSVANIGTRLASEGEIERESGQWRATEPAKCPVLLDGYAWGPRDVFERQEVAAYRRLCLLHLLNVHPGGMQAAQIVNTFAQCDWLLDTPMNKDLVKEDLIALQADGRVKRVGGGSNKWRAA